MGYTRTQLKQARQAKSNLEKKIESKLELAIALGMAAVTGTLAGLALSYVNLPHLIAGRIIGSAMLLVCCVISACSFSKTTNLNDIPESMSEENKQILREYSNSAEYKIKNYACTISSIGVFFWSWSRTSCSWFYITSSYRCFNFCSEYDSLYFFKFLN